MAASILPGYPTYPQHSYVVTLGELRYRCTFTWRERQQSWYLDLSTQDGTELALGRRLAPGWSPLGAVDLGDYALPGILMCRGPENYQRLDWGTELVLVFVPADDINAATTAVVSDLVFKVT